MSYLTQPATSNRKLYALAAAALLHVFLGYAFYTGLAQDVIKKVVEPIETVNVEEEKLPDEPPPPPPELEEVQVVTPPPLVTVETPPPPTAIRTETTIIRPIAPVAPTPAPTPEPVVVAPPAPPPPPPSAAVRAKLRNARSTAISTADYPAASMRAEEEGTTVVKYDINEQGRVDKCDIVQTSGHDRLDTTTCTLIMRRFRFDPAKAAGGAPMRSSETQRVRWQIPKE